MIVYTVIKVVGSVGEMTKSTKVDKELACAHIDKLVGRLQGLKRKVFLSLCLSSPFFLQ